MISEDILRFLATFNRAPIDVKVLYRYVRNHSDIEIKVALTRLRRRGLIDNLGTRRHFKFVITEAGISHIERLDRKAFLWNINHELEKYLHKLGGYD
jgi:hypothetical protein